jgi:hypothetical protein
MIINIDAFWIKVAYISLNKAYNIIKNHLGPLESHQSQRCMFFKKVKVNGY